MRIAAIDCGSNSFHLLIADVGNHDQINIIEENKTFLYLGSEVAKKGRISHSSTIRAKRVLKHYRNSIRQLKVEKVIAVATSAIRSAENGVSAISSLSQSLGHPIEVISGHREAQIIFRAISALSALPESRILAIDMGGGSLELMAGQRNGLEEALSLPLGGGRIANEFKVSDPLSQADIKSISDHARFLTKEFKDKFPIDLFSNVVVSSGTLTTIVKMARALKDGVIPSETHTISATNDEISDLCDRVISANKKQRRKMIGYDSNRDQLFPSACVITKELLKLTSQDASWQVSPYALREGLVLIQADEHYGIASSQKDVRKATIDDLATKMSAIVPTALEHGKHTQKLAVKLFDDLKELHHLDDNLRDILSHAALIHDVGDTITHSKHDQHGSYILANIPLAGFTGTEAVILRAIVRWHRKKNPKKHSQYIGRMNDKDFAKAKWLTAILRVADGADSAKTSNVESIDVSIKPDSIFLRLNAENNCDLEIYSARAKRLLLEEMTKRDVIIKDRI